MRLRRSTLICPADNWDLLVKLARGPEDVAIAELEDGVGLDQKPAARESCERGLTELDWGRRERIVRINGVTTGQVELDIAAITRGRPDGVLMTKTASADEVRHVSSLLAAAEIGCGAEVGSTQIWAMIETARGLVNVEAICTADPRMTAICFGGGDYAADVRVKRISLGPFRRSPLPSPEYVYARGRIVAAARAFGLDPIDVGSTDVQDLELAREMAELSAQLGFSGTACFSPRQVEVANRAFSPPDDDLEWADEVLAAIEVARSSGRNVAVVRNEMIDGPFVENARQIRERAELSRSLGDQ